jgi:hypothetical protein
VDGYYENENGQKYFLEFNGKFWHGCLHCYNASTVNSFVLLYICKTLGDDLRVSDGYFSGLIDIWIQGGYIDV